MADNLTVEGIASRLRDSIETECYGEAQIVLDEYCRRLQEIWHSLSSDKRSNSRLWIDAMELLGWAHRMLSSTRAHSVDQLRRLPRSLPYHAFEASCESWEVTG